MPKIKHSPDFNPYSTRMDAMKLTMPREKSEGDNTFGLLYIDSVEFCHTVEDVVRADGEKVHGKTAIPALVYSVDVTYSPAFSKLLPLIYNQKDLSIKHEGIVFKGVRFHGGIDNTSSEGCPCIGYEKVGAKLKKTLEASKELTRILMEAKGYDPIWDGKWWIKGPNQTEGKEITLEVTNHV